MRRILSGTRCFEGCTAAAGTSRVWVHNTETGASEAVIIIESRAVEHRATLGVDEKFHAIAFDDGVAVLPFVEDHFILKAGAAALGDLHAQTFVLRLRLRLQKGPEMLRSLFRDVYHRDKNYRGAWASQTTQSGANSVRERFFFANAVRKFTLR